MLAEEPDVRKALVRFREGLGGNLRGAPSLLDYRLGWAKLASPRATTDCPTSFEDFAACGSKLPQNKAQASLRTPKPKAGTPLCPRNNRPHPIKQLKTHNATSRISGGCRRRSPTG